MSTASDTFSNSTEGLNSPPDHVFAITPNDSADLPNVTRALWVASAGNLQVTLNGMADGTSVVYQNVPVGRISMRVKRVWAASTSASAGLLGEY